MLMALLAENGFEEGLLLCDPVKPTPDAKHVGLAVLHFKGGRHRVD